MPHFRCVSASIYESETVLGAACRQDPGACGRQDLGSWLSTREDGRRGPLVPASRVRYPAPALASTRHLFDREAMRGEHHWLETAKVQAECRRGGAHRDEPAGVASRWSMRENPHPYQRAWTRSRSESHDSQGHLEDAASWCCGVRCARGSACW